MPIKHLVAWLPLVGIALCGLASVAFFSGDRCVGAPWGCHTEDIFLDLAPMILTALVPLLLFVGLGLRAGIRQYRRTREALRWVLCLPRRSPSRVLQTVAAELGIARRIDVVESADLEAFCYGLLRPRICVTSGLVQALSVPELDAVLRHERHHLERRDPLRTLLWTVLDGACWWLDDGSASARLRRELAADRVVIEAGRRHDLARALLKLLTHTRRHDPLGELALSSLSVTDARIDQLLQPERVLLPPAPLWRWLTLPVVTLIAALICSVVMTRA
jgi:Zn-dependent protease with chaperone function